MNEKLGPSHLPSALDASKPNPARVYDYWLGGKDNFAADREAGERILQAYPALRQSTQSNRSFLGRAVGYLVLEAGVRQFLDIGTGLPAADNTHEVAQRAAPDSRIVYVDNDPMVYLHAQALLQSAPQGACDYLLADLRDPGSILDRAARALDFGQPVALLLLAILQLIPDHEDPYGLVGQLVEALPSGSYLVISHPTDDFNPNPGESIQVYQDRVLEDVTLRDEAGTVKFFDGLRLLAPGVVPTSRWRPDSDAISALPSSMWCGVAVKP